MTCSMTQIAVLSVSFKDHRYCIMFSFTTQQIPRVRREGAWAKSDTRGLNIMSAATAKVEVVLITNEEDIHLASRSMKAMAHPLRLKILCILGGNTEVSVQDIVEQVGTSQS